MKLSTHSHQAPRAFRRLLPLLLAPVAITAATAQSMDPLSLQDGLSMATEEAHSSLGTDAVLVGIVANASPSAPTWAPIDFTNGTAGYWIYGFFSPAAGRVANVAIWKSGNSISGGTSLSPLTSPTPPPPLDLDQQYAAMASLPAQMGTDPTYTHFKALFPEMVPMTIQLGPPYFSAETRAKLPSTFPLDKQVWQVIFAASPTMMGSNLTCIVVTSTGETFCLDDNVQVSSVDAAQTRESARLTASPNPAGGLVRIDLPESAIHGAGAKAELFDALGNHLRDLSDDLARNGGGFVIVDTRELPDGLYICRASAGDWSASMGVVVRH